MKTNDPKPGFDWINFGPVDSAVLAEFDAIRNPAIGRGSFLAVIARSEAGRNADLAPYAGKCQTGRAMFGRVRHAEYDRTRKTAMPRGVTRSGFLKAMVDTAKREGFVWQSPAQA